MKTDESRFETVHALFAKVADLESSQQEQVLQRECAGDAELEQQVRALLMADAGMPVGKLTRAVAAAKKGSSRTSKHDLVGSTLGHYKLLSILGRGGAGSVYLAERIDRKFSARVAIKVVEETADDILGARFAAEIQILATLNHPNIAHLIDVGESTENYPYIVMEYVHGDSLDRYCDDNMLSLTQRLRLFLQVCSAMQYAHQNLVVHRDLKPSNILVTDDGTTKLLDFGIAKLLSSTAATPALTRLYDRALTPEYASPEQISGRIVTTASDVYSLGVLLYELLSGLSPYELNGDNQLEMERAICNVDPLKPSAAVARAANPEHAQRLVAQSAAAARRLSTNRLRDALIGDLDAIVMRALRKEPDKRYASVEMFAADVQRYLKFEAVIARQGNWSYNSRRFLRRHWIPVSAASVVGVILLVGSIAMTFLYRQARIDRDRAEQASQFMSSIFSDMNPDLTQGRAATVLDLLDLASERLSGLSADLEVQAQLRNQVGMAYLNLGRYGQAVPHLKMAADVQRRFHSDNSVVLATTLVGLADAERSDGDFEAAEHHYREVQRLLGSKQNKPSSEYAYLLRMMGRLETIRDDLKAAERDLLASAKISRQLDPESIQLALALGDLAVLYLWTNELPAAERVGREAISIVRKTLPERHPDRIMAQLTLANILSERGYKSEAETLLEESVIAQRAVYHNSGPVLAQGLYLLAWAKYAQGKSDETDSLLHESLDLAQRSLGMAHYQIGYYFTSLGRLALYRDQLADAEKYFRTSLEIFTNSLPEHHQYVASSQYWLGEALLAMRRFDEAEKALSDSRDLWIAAKAAPWFAARTESALGQVYAIQGFGEKAEQYLRKSYETLLENRGPEDEATRASYQRLHAFMDTKYERSAE